MDALGGVWNELAWRRAWNASRRTGGGGVFAPLQVDVLRKEIETKALGCDAARGSTQFFCVTCSVLPGATCQYVFSAFPRTLSLKKKNEPANSVIQ
jgi:hypothetical protein